MVRPGYFFGMIDHIKFEAENAVPSFGSVSFYSTYPAFFSFKYWLFFQCYFYSISNIEEIARMLLSAPILIYWLKT